MRRSKLDSNYEGVPRTLAIVPPAKKRAQEEFVEMMEDEKKELADMRKPRVLPVRKSLPPNDAPSIFLSRDSSTPKPVSPSQEEVAVVADTADTDAYSLVMPDSEITL